jgi:glucose/arabinose dehydrogenase/PKD repeat protein
VSTAYARHIGRVGALAVALGIGGALVTTSPVALADDAPPSTSSSSDSSSSEAGTGPTSAVETDASSPNPSANPTSQATRDSDTATPTASAEQSNGSAGPVSQSEKVSKLDAGVIVRSSGGAQSSDVDDPELADAGADEPKPPPPTHTSDSADARVEPSVHTLAVPVMNAAGPRGRSSKVESRAEAPTAGAGTATVPPTTEPVVAPQAQIESTPQPIQQLQSEPATLTAVDPFDDAPAPVGPTAPSESPLALAVLGWLRRQAGQESLATDAAAATVETGQADVAVAASSLPDEFERTVLVSGLENPVDFRILPGDDEDPAILIAEKNGAIKLYHDGHVETVITLPATTASERGIGGIELDPDFATNHYLYVSYTTLEGGVNYNRLSRLVLSSDLHSVVSERVILRNSEPGAIHHGGEIRFGPVDGMLYWSTGDNSYAPNAQDLSNLHGKIMRIDPNTLEAPPDNPFVNTPGARDEIYAYGFRNPFRFTFTPDGKLLVADVGNASWEELDVVTKGANYGWPLEEGNCGNCGYANPIYTYPHTPLPQRAGAISSVLYYTGDAFGDDYQNKVFIADYSIGWIKVLTFDEAFTSFIDEQMFDPQGGAVVKLSQGPDGNIYQLNIYPGELSVIAPSGGNRAPSAVIAATPDNGYPDLAVQFSGAGSTDPEGSNLNYAWDFGIDGDDDTSTAVAPTWTYNQNGTYLVTLTVTDPEGRIGQATHRVVVGSTAPTIDGKITVTIDGEIADSETKYDAGDTITFSATAKDAEDGRAGDGVMTDPAAYNWTVVFHHADHIHPFRDDIIGTGGSITIPRDAHNVDTTWYEIRLTVTDSSGLSTTKFVEVHPNLVELQFTSNDPDAIYTIDGVPHQGTYSERGVVGVERVIAAVPQYVNGTRLVFGSWSDGRLASHTITTPGTATTYSLTYDKYVAPNTPDLSSIPTQILASQAANAKRLLDAAATLAGVVSAAVADVPAGLVNAVLAASADPTRIPAITLDVFNGALDTLSRATVPVLNALTDVAATEAIRIVGVAAALASNVVPVSIAVLTAPAAISNVLLHSAIDLVQAVIALDPEGVYNILDVGRVTLEAEVAEQGGLVPGAFANLFDDLSSSYGIPLPPPSENGTSLVSALARTLRIADQVVRSSVDILGATVVGQARVAQQTGDGLQVFLAANAGPETALDWVVHTLAGVSREANAARLEVQQTLDAAADRLGAAGAD